MQVPLAPRISLLAIDVDNTLLNSEHHVPVACRDAVARVLDAGALVVLASGRSPTALRPVIRALGHGETAICFNGAWVGDIGPEPGVSHSRSADCPVPLEVARNAVRLVRTLELELGWYTGESVYLDQPGPLFSRELAITAEQPSYAALTTLATPPHKLLARCEAADVSRLSALATQLRTLCDASFSRDDALEVSARGVSKASGLATFCRELGIGLDQVAAIGDAENDLAMIRGVGLGIAMGNAVPAVKKAARWITDSNDAHGVAAAIHKLFAEKCIVPFPRRQPAQEEGSDVSLVPH